MRGGLRLMSSAEYFGEAGSQARFGGMIIDKRVLIQESSIRIDRDSVGSAIQAEYFDSVECYFLLHVWPQCHC